VGAPPLGRVVGGPFVDLEPAVIVVGGGTQQRVAHARKLEAMVAPASAHLTREGRVVGLGDENFARRVTSIGSPRDHAPA